MMVFMIMSDDDDDDECKSLMQSVVSFFQLVDVDVIAGLDMMVQRGQWDKAIETAEQQVRRTAFSILPCDNQNLNNNGTGLNFHIYFFVNGFMPV